MHYGRYTMAVISSGPVTEERVLQHESGGKNEAGAYRLQSGAKANPSL